MLCIGFTSSAQAGAMNPKMNRINKIEPFLIMDISIFEIIESESCE